MLKKYLLLITAGLALLRGAPMEAHIPTHLIIKEHKFHTGVVFDVESKEGKLGKVHRKFLNVNTIYEYVDLMGDIQAQARMRFFSFGPVFDVFDGDGVLLGSVEEHAFDFFPSFDIFTPNKALLAKAKMNFWKTKFTIFDPISKKTIATLTRSLFKIREKWKVKIVNDDYISRDYIDPRLFITLAAFQCDRDHWKPIAKGNRPGTIVYAGLDLGDERINPAPLFAMLQEVEPIVAGIIPSNEDVAFVHGYLEAYIDTIDVTEYDSVQDALETGFSQLIPLFYSDQFTASQKAALYYILQQFIINVSSQQD